MTIAREGQNEWRLSTSNLTLTWDELKQRIGHVWTEEQLARLKEMEVGDETAKPLPFYEFIRDGQLVRFASKDGVPDLKKPLDGA